MRRIGIDNMHFDELFMGGKICFLEHLALERSLLRHSASWIQAGFLRFGMLPLDSQHCTKQISRIYRLGVLGS